MGTLPGNGNPDGDLDVVALDAAGDASVFGGKAANLARAARCGLPVPPGLALGWAVVDAVAAGDGTATTMVAEACTSLDGPLAVRSSAVGEDSAVASFAGQHVSVLNARGAAAAVDAVRAVWRSGRAESAMAYRRRLGVAGSPRVGVVVQRLVDPDVAGVAFDGNPVTGADELVIEASWGLGEVVVAGTVAPDFFRLGPAGEVLERRLGRKDVELRPAPAGGTVTRAVPAERAGAWSLSDDGLGRVRGLALSCREVFGGSQDVEWALAGRTWWLLQRRPVTRLPAPPGASRP